jgi:glycerol uptake facilitator-like aquaporin
MVVGTFFGASLIFVTFLGSIYLAHKNDEECAGRNSSSPSMAKVLRTLLWVVAISGLLLVLIPSRKDLVESYAMVEGSRIVNAESSEQAAVKVGKLFDVLIEKLQEKETK